MRNSLLILANLAILLSISEACHRKGIKAIFDDKSGQPEIHHHHYNSDPGLPHPEELHSPEPIYGPDGPEEPAKHVVVLQPALPPNPVEDDIFDLWPKKLHPKHILKSHIHKLRSKFRELFFDDKYPQPPHPGIHKHLHKRPHLPHPPPPYHHQHPGHVAVPALKVPLIQVEAYKTAPYPGIKGHAVAYVSPDGYQPAVVVKTKSHPHHHPQAHPAEYAHGPPPEHYASPSPAEAYQPTPQPAYYNHPSYQPQHPHPYPPQPQPEAYQNQHSYPAQPGYAPQGVSSPYGPQGYQSTQPLYEPQQPQSQPGQFPGGNYFGQSSQPGFGSPYSLGSSSFGASSHGHYKK